MSMKAFLTFLLTIVRVRATLNTDYKQDHEAVFSSFFKYDVKGIDEEILVNDSSRLDTMHQELKSAITTNLRASHQRQLQQQQREKHRILLECDLSQKETILIIVTDDFPTDTTWVLQDSFGRTIASSPSNIGASAYQANTKYEINLCLDEGVTYIFTVKDAWGDGLKIGEGYYSLNVEDSDGMMKEVISGGDFRYESVETFDVTSDGGTSGVSNSTSSMQTPHRMFRLSNYASANSDSNQNNNFARPSFQATGANLEQFSGGSIKKFTSRMGCRSNERKAKFEIKLDKFGSETTWKLQSDDGVVYMKNSRQYGANDYEVTEQCLPEGNYRLVILDDGGDGICCSRGNGYFTLSLENNGSWDRLFKGGKFSGKKETQKIKIGGTFMNSRDEEWLVAHNTRRKRYHKQYGTSYVPLKWSEGLKEISAQYAEELLSSCPSPTIIHDPLTAYGENLAKNFGTDGWGELKTADKIVNRFVEREIGWEWPHNAHLTQALWRATRYVGCAESVKPMGAGMCRIQVCRYARAGNCNVKKSDPMDWKEKMLMSESDCEPICPPEGKIDEKF